MRRSLLGAAAIVLALSACNSQQADVTSSASSDSSVFTDTPTEALQFLVVDLEDDGDHVVQIVTAANPTVLPGAVAAHQLTFDDEPIVVYVFPDEAATDAAVLALNGTGTGSSLFANGAQAYRHDQTIVIYAGDDPATISALGDVLEEFISTGSSEATAMSSE